MYWKDIRFVNHRFTARTKQKINSPGTNNTGYKKWAGTKTEPGTEWINHERILYTFKELTSKGKKIKEGIRKDIANALILYQTNENSRSDAPLLGIGTDHVDNRPVNKRRRDEV